jgi:hypothetical protein
VDGELDGGSIRRNGDAALPPTGLHVSRVLEPCLVDARSCGSIPAGNYALRFFDDTTRIEDGVVVPMGAPPAETTAIDCSFADAGGQGIVSKELLARLPAILAGQQVYVAVNRLNWTTVKAGSWTVSLGAESTLTVRVKLQ